MILKVGLTGGLASGKSTVGQILAGLGCKVIDADRIVAELYEPGRAGYESLVREYGREVLAADRSIDRAWLASKAFSSPEEAARLNALIHPLVLEREATMIGEESERQSPEDRIVVVEATLLLEAGGKDRYDRILVVDAPSEVQIERAEQRGMDRTDAAQRIARQMPRQQRLAAADYVIDNAGDEESLERETRRIHQRLVEDLSELSRSVRS